MGNRLRQGNSTKMSFFAFQDIITAVTGILILVTLILTLFVTSPSTMWDADGAQEDPMVTQMREIENQLKQVNSENRARQILMAQTTSAPSVERLDAEMESIRSEVNAMRKELEIARKKVTEQQLDADILARELGLGRKSKATVRVEEVVQKNRLWLVPDYSRDSKQNMLVILNKDTIRVRKYGTLEGEEVFSGNAAPGQFVTALKGWDPAKVSLVFYIRPSGIRLFNFCIQRARATGFTVGFDAIGETLQLDLDQG
ncbi:hypothetical protein N9B94_00730 [Verrucomicrobia bacterium]|nr:hypothetical protein [Verrucomicrobiota bacterium]